jgi:hypothetical protein
VREHGLVHALFTPVAAGTVRVLSERPFFPDFFRAVRTPRDPLPELDVSHASGSAHPDSAARREPHRVLRRGLPAALIWPANSNAVLASGWPSAHYQIAGAFCLPAAF